MNPRHLNLERRITWLELEVNWLIATCWLLAGPVGLETEVVQASSLLQTGEAGVRCTNMTKKKTTTLFTELKYALSLQL